jgi:hypothetical protein
VRASENMKLPSSWRESRAQRPQLRRACAGRYGEAVACGGGAPACRRGAAEPALAMYARVCVAMRHGLVCMRPPLFFPLQLMSLSSSAKEHIGVAYDKLAAQPRVQTAYEASLGARDKLVSVVSGVVSAVCFFAGPARTTTSEEALLLSPWKREGSTRTQQGVPLPVVVPHAVPALSPPSPRPPPALPTHTHPHTPILMSTCSHRPWAALHTRHC